MRAWALRTLFFLAVAQPAAGWAHEGLYVGLAAGGVRVSGQRHLGESHFGRDNLGLPLRLFGATLSTDTTDGAASRVTLGYRLDPAVAIEASFAAHGNHLFDGDARQWALHAHVGARAWPLALVPSLASKLPSWLAPTANLGLGYSSQVYSYIEDGDAVGFRGPSLKLGLGLDMALSRSLHATLDYEFLYARLTTFTYSFVEHYTFPVKPPLGARFHGVLVGLAYTLGGDSDAP